MSTLNTNVHDLISESCLNGQECMCSKINVSVDSKILTTCNFQSKYTMLQWKLSMMTSSNGNIFRVTGHLGGDRSPVNSPHKGQWRGALMFSLICVWINGWVNNREAGDLRRYRGHYDVNVMMKPIWNPQVIKCVLIVIHTKCEVVRTSL